ncbi:MAG: hypothetical protein EU536_00725 [Promethearchaeota archaeon]|nr:MAG: hypothetical protein EU536_00725 [Candidatus Lokiarchaeota archaeon]
MKRNQKRKKDLLSEGLEFCTTFVNTYVTSPAEWVALKKQCLVDWQLASEQERARLLAQFQISGDPCFEGRAYAPDQETADAFERWCRSRTPSIDQIPRPTTNEEKTPAADQETADAFERWYRSWVPSIAPISLKFASPDRVAKATPPTEIEVGYELLFGHPIKLPHSLLLRMKEDILNPKREPVKVFEIDSQDLEPFLRIEKSTELASFIAERRERMHEQSREILVERGFLILQDQNNHIRATHTRDGTLVWFDLQGALEEVHQDETPLGAFHTHPLEEYPSPSFGDLHAFVGGMDVLAIGGMDGLDPVVAVYFPRSQVDRVQVLHPLVREMRRELMPNPIGIWLIDMEGQSIPGLKEGVRLPYFPLSIFDKTQLNEMAKRFNSYLATYLQITVINLATWEVTTIGSPLKEGHTRFTAPYRHGSPAPPRPSTPLATKARIMPIEYAPTLPPFLKYLDPWQGDPPLSTKARIMPIEYAPILPPFLKYLDPWQGDPPLPAAPRTQVPEIFMRTGSKFYTPRQTDTIPGLETLIDGKLYAYNHSQALERKGLINKKDLLTYLRLRLLPRVFFFREKNVLYIIDAVGYDEGANPLLQVNYQEILQEVSSLLGQERGAPRLPMGYKVIISHAHPDHFGGLLQLARHLPKPLQVLTSKNLPNYLKDYTGSYIHPEDEEIHHATGWDPTFIKGLRELLSLYFGNGINYNEIAHQIRFIDTADQGVTIREVSQAHAETVSIVILDKTLIFLDDLFPPYYALATTFLPHASWEKLKAFYDGLLGRGSAQSTTPLDARFFWSHKLSQPFPEPAHKKDLTKGFKAVEQWVEEAVWTKYKAIKNTLKQDQTPLLKRALFERLLTSSPLIHDVFTKFIPRGRPSADRKEIEERERVLNQVVELASFEGQVQFRPIWVKGEARIIEAWSTMQIYTFDPLSLLDAIYYFFLLLNMVEYFESGGGEVYIGAEDKRSNGSDRMPRQKFRTAEKTVGEPSPPSAKPLTGKKAERGPARLKVIWYNEFFSYQRIPLETAEFHAQVQRFRVGKSETYNRTLDGERTYKTRLDERIPVLVMDGRVYYPVQYHPTVQRDEHLQELSLCAYMDYTIEAYPELTEALFAELQKIYPDLIRGFALQIPTWDIWVSPMAQKVFCETEVVPGVESYFEMYQDLPVI